MTSPIHHGWMAKQQFFGSAKRYCAIYLHDRTLRCFQSLEHFLFHRAAKREYRIVDVCEFPDLSRTIQVYYREDQNAIRKYVLLRTKDEKEHQRWLLAFQSVLKKPSPFGRQKIHKRESSEFSSASTCSMVDDLIHLTLPSVEKEVPVPESETSAPPVDGLSNYTLLWSSPKVVNQAYTVDDLSNFTLLRSSPKDISRAHSCPYVSGSDRVSYELDVVRGSVSEKFDLNLPDGETRVIDTVTVDIDEVIDVSFPQSSANEISIISM